MFTKAKSPKLVAMVILTVGILTLPYTLWFLAPLVLATVFLLLVFYLQLLWVDFKTWLKRNVLLLIDPSEERAKKAKKSLDLGEVVLAFSYFSYNYISKPIMANNVHYGKSCDLSIEYEKICFLWDSANKLTHFLIVYIPIILVSVFTIIKITLFLVQIINKINKIY